MHFRCLCNQTTLLSGLTGLIKQGKLKKLLIDKESRVTTSVLECIALGFEKLTQLHFSSVPPGELARKIKNCYALFCLLSDKSKNNDHIFFYFSICTPCDPEQAFANLTPRGCGLKPSCLHHQQQSFK